MIWKRITEKVDQNKQKAIIIYEDHQYSKKKIEDFEDIVTGERLTAFEALLLGVILVKRSDAGLKAKGFACLDEF